MRYLSYSSGTVQALLQTDLVTPQTKQVLQQRIDAKPVMAPQFFSIDEFKILKAVCDRLIPQQRQNPIDIAGQLDTDLAANKGNGWRYDSLPPDQQTFKSGIKGVEETADKLYHSSYINLPEKQQDEVLTRIQNGNAMGETWQQLPGKLFFEELLSRLVEFYYSHPIAKDEIGDVSFADAHGWQQIQLNEKEMQEPMPAEETTV